MSALTPEDVIRLLRLEPHPEEGGFFAETYRSAESVLQEHLPGPYDGPRAHGTAIYYMLTPATFSHIHRLKSDEIFHFYLGDPCEMIQLHPDGSAKTIVLGQDIAAGHKLQALAPKGVWQGTRLLPGGSFGLLGCTVAPGFEYADYEHGDRSALIRQYPMAEKLITLLTSD
ncbi:cupin domain-containing protein [Salidesulfovibrio onnuriiensis]|uniref:cupin domain-containing protein n=1 Tax=Salidesulfovibrio onnuriiensis TaxID=2583823 RepID=UPI0011CA19E0|nr:cupin domain-containing protein [Salidesulfovibrio onnuriiensis]